MKDNNSQWREKLDSARNRYREFIDSCRAGPDSYKLTTNSEETPYALCFAIYGLWLLKDVETLRAEREVLSSALNRNIRNMRESDTCLIHSKDYRQLLSMTLSALSILSELKSETLKDLVVEQLPDDVEESLKYFGTFDGKYQSGNQAMFLAIFLLHAEKYFRIDVERKLDIWIESHLNALNKFGFWGDSCSMTHLLFQNGYHQYELLEFLNVDNPCQAIAAENVVSLADSHGHFAPYPGGGGCYDYDAVFIITSAGPESVQRHKNLLERTAYNILSEQNIDGGFCESHYVRPRSFTNLGRFINHIRDSSGHARVERIKYGLTLQRPKHDRVHTHWTEYSRRWNESDMWDSWFRMLTVARIDIAFNSDAIERWGFIDYPGIGFHPLAGN